MQIQRFHSAGITPSSGNNGKLYRNSINSSNHLHSESVVIFSLGNTFASVFFVQRKQTIGVNANVMAYLNGKAVHNIFHAGIKSFDRFSYTLKNTVCQFFYGVQPSVKATLA